MLTKTDDKQMREYRRHMLRGEFRSLFWVMFSERKRSKRFTLQAFADKLGIGKSSLSRGFNEPQNWTIDKMSDMAEALGVELVVEARDRKTNAVYTPIGVISNVETTNSVKAKSTIFAGNSAYTTTSSCSGKIMRLAA